MEAKTLAKNISVSPRKLRLIADVVRGKPVQEALVILQFMPEHAAADVARAVRTAMANAENTYQMNPQALRISAITIEEGLKLRRMMPMARGRAGRVNKRHSHIRVVVSDGEAQRGA